MTLEELEILENYNKEKESIEQQQKEKLESLDRFLKNVSTENGINIYFTSEEECQKLMHYNTTTNPVFSFFRTSKYTFNYGYDLNIDNETISKKCRENARKLIRLIIEKCKEESIQKIKDLETELKKSLTNK